jgi:hypothetical protein
MRHHDARGRVGAIEPLDFPGDKSSQIVPTKTSSAAAQADASASRPVQRRAKPRPRARTPGFAGVPVPDFKNYQKDKVFIAGSPAPRVNGPAINK